MHHLVGHAGQSSWMRRITVVQRSAAVVTVTAASQQGQRASNNCTATDNSLDAIKRCQPRLAPISQLASVIPVATSTPCPCCRVLLPHLAVHHSLRQSLHSTGVANCPVLLLQTNRSEITDN